jgi:uncharacterized membrane protein YcaP (DUF421 family)
VIAVYTALLLMVRVSGRREIGELGPLDLLGMLLLSETVSPALTGEDASLPAALVAAATLLTLAATIGRLTFGSRVLERLIDGSPREIITDGTIDREVCRSERITEQELGSALRQQGVASAEEVERATVEPTGRITVVKKQAAS